jgi:hypothetical protein
MFTAKGSGFCKISYQNGLRAKDDEHFNYIGLENGS